MNIEFSFLATATCGRVKIFISSVLKIYFYTLGCVQRNEEVNTKFSFLTAVE